MNNIKNAMISNFGIVGKRGKRKFFLSEDKACHTLYSNNKNKYIEIQGISLKDVFDLNKINRCNFLKIDVEGGEYEILFNTPKEYFQRIEKISLEPHNIEGNTP